MLEETQKADILEESKIEGVDKEQVSENGSSTIWSEISMGKTKEIREVIEIGEEKSNTSQSNIETGSNPPQETEKRIEAVQKEITMTFQNYREDCINNQNPIKGECETPQEAQNPYKLRNGKENLIFERNVNEYISSREVFPTGQMDMYGLRELRENQEIYNMKKEELLKGFLDDKSQIKEVQLKAVEWLYENYSKVNNKNQSNHGTNKFQKFNVIRTIDLLYKKYIVLPLKTELEQLQGETASQYDIYKPDFIYCERQYSLIDNSIPRQLPEAYKRNSAGRAYNENVVSLLDESTNENQDYLESIASNYVNGMRRPRIPDSPNNLQTTRPSNPQPSDKFKKYGPSSSENALPFDIDVYDNGPKKQFSNEYNHFQSNDDEKSERFKQERIVAKTFVKDGYGLQIIRNYMGPSMDGGTYNRAITTIIRESYKKIEDFLTKTCNMKIHCLTSQEFSLVKTPLVHCRNTLRQSDLTTFFKYVTITYSFSKLKKEDYPTAEETLSLYNSILHGLTDRKSAKEHLPKPNIHRDLYHR